MLAVENEWGERYILKAARGVRAEALKWGMFNSDGEQVVPFKYDWLEFPNAEGYVLAERNGVHGLVSPSGAEAGGFEAPLTPVDVFTNGHTAVGLYFQDETGTGGPRYTYYNLKGEKVIENTPHQLFIPYDGKAVAGASLDDEYVLNYVEVTDDYEINIIKEIARGDGVSPFGALGEGYYSHYQMISNNGKRGLIDLLNGEMVVPFMYDGLRRVGAIGLEHFLVLEHRRVPVEGQAHRPQHHLPGVNSGGKADGRDDDKVNGVRHNQQDKPEYDVDNRIEDDIVACAS